MAKRADGSLSRWDAIAPVVRELGVRTAVDIGAGEGYFSIQLGAYGVTTVALEAAPANQRTALLAVRRSGLDNVGVLAFELRDETVEMVPPGRLHGLPLALAPPRARQRARVATAHHRADLGQDRRR